MNSLADLHATLGKEPLLIVEDGGPRVLSHDLATEMISFVGFNGRLRMPDLQYFCGALLHDRYIDRPLSLHELASLVDVDTISVGQLPGTPIIKMMAEKHATALCERGGLRLGSIDYYRKYEDAEIGDNTEGLCVLAAWDGTKTVVSKIRGGLNDWLLCTFEGNVDRKIVDRMGYDSAVEITDVEAFSSAISTHLSSLSANYGSIKYVRDRALYGEVKRPIDPQEFMDGPIAEVLGDARVFLKNQYFSHQSEFRFRWNVANRAAEFIDIVCPQLTAFCRPVAMPAS